MSREKKKTMTMWALYALYFLCVLLVQDTVLGKVRPAGVRLLLVPAAIVCVCVFTGAEQGGIFALASGTFYALSGVSYGGVWVLTLTLCGALSGWLCDAVFHRRLPVGLLVCFLSQLVTLGILLLTRLYFRGGDLADLRYYFRQVLLSLPACPIFYGLCAAIRKVGA